MMKHWTAPSMRSSHLSQAFNMSMAGIVIFLAVSEDIASKLCSGISTQAIKGQQAICVSMSSHAGVRIP